MNALYNAYLQMLNTITSEEGQGMAEYGLIIALVAVALIAALGLLTGGISGVFADIVSGFSAT
jgi:pilus assembly protein Flp/PilA